MVLRAARLKKKPECTATTHHNGAMPCHLIHKNASSKDTHTDWVCALCGERFTHKTDLLRHAAAHIHTSGKGDTVSGDNVSRGSRVATRDCSVRLERCSRAAAAARAATPAPALPGAAYQCDFCSQSYSQKHQLIRHIKEHLRHQNTNKSLSHVRRNTVFSKVKNRVRTHTCEVCKKTFASSTNLKRHFRTHAGDKPYSCDVCNKSFSLRDSLRRHSKIHATKPEEKTRSNEKKSKKAQIKEILRKYACDICDKMFVSYTALDTHIRVHSGEKPYSCEICNSKFTQASDLKSHWLIHTGEKPYYCEVCKKSFRKVSDLNRHKRLHFGEKPYSCEVCKKEFTRMEHLTVHRRIHSGEKPYTCDICSKKFPYSYTLKKHTQRHKKETNESSIEEILPCRIIICKEKNIVEK